MTYSVLQYILYAKRHVYTHIGKYYSLPMYFLSELLLAETQTPMHLRSLEGRQNILLPLLLCSCNKRSCRERKLRLHQIKTSACMEYLSVSGPESIFTHPQQWFQKWSCHTCPLLLLHTCSPQHLQGPLWWSSFHKYRSWGENSQYYLVISERGSHHTVHLSHTPTLVFLS